MPAKKRVSRSKKRTSRSRTRSSSPLRGRSLLIVDDDDVFARAVRRWAEKEGARATVARHGREALDRLRGEEYDALVVDLRMPEMDGYELHLRLAVEQPDLLRRAVFVTGDLANPEATDFFTRSGCACLEKPFELDDLGRALQRLF